MSVPVPLVPIGKTVVEIRMVRELVLFGPTRVGAEMFRLTAVETSLLGVKVE